MKKCPYCAEEIQEQAIVCRYCHRDLVPVPSPPRRSRAGVMFAFTLLAALALYGLLSSGGLLPSLTELAVLAGPTRTVAPSPLPPTPNYAATLQAAIGTCMSAYQVTQKEEGKRVCVYGTVSDVYATDKNIMIHLEDTTGAMIMRSVISHDTTLLVRERDCIMATGIVTLPQVQPGQPTPAGIGRLVLSTGLFIDMTGDQDELTRITNGIRCPKIQ